MLIRDKGNSCICQIKYDDIFSVSVQCSVFAPHLYFLLIKTRHDSISIGKYENKDYALQVLEDLIEFIRHGGDDDIFYVPEDTHAEQR